MGRNSDRNAEYLCSKKIDELRDPIDAVLTFSVMQSPNPPTLHHSIASNFVRAWQGVYAYVTPHLCYAETTEIGTEPYKERIAGILTQAHATKDAFAKQLEADKIRMEK